MKNKILIILSAIFLFPTSLFSQDGRGGIHASLLGNYNFFYLTRTENITGFHSKVTLAANDYFPDPEKYMESYQFGFLNAKKDWHDFRFSFIYMPETTKEYTKVKDGDEWIDPGFGNISKDMELYLMNMSHIYKLNLMSHRVYILAGFGVGGGVIRWPSYDSEGNDLYFLSYYAFPVAGMELKLTKKISLTGEYHYQYGNTNTQTESVTGGNIKWDYHLEGHEVALGINLYF